VPETRTPPPARTDARRASRLGRVMLDLRLRLVALVLLSFGPPAALLITSELQQREHELGNARRELTRAAAVAGAEFDARLRSAQLLLAGLANVAAIRSAQEPRCSALLGELFARGAGLGGLFVLDRDGRTVCSATPGPQGLSFADRDYFRETVARRAPTIGVPLLARPHGRALLGLGHPLLGDAGEVRGVLVTSLDLAAFAEQLAALDPVAGAAVTLIDARGEILFRYPDAERWLGQRLPDAVLVRAALASTRGTAVEARGLDAVDRVYALAPLGAETGQVLRLALGVARSDIDGPVNEIVRRDLAAITLLAVLTLAAALLIAQRSVHAPARRVLEVAHGERERVQAELALREERMQLQAAALSAAANGIVITDRDGTIRWVNAAFSRLTGYSADEAIGRNPRILKSGQHDAAFYAGLYRTVLCGEVWRGEMVNRRKDGSRYTEDQTITPVRSDSGEITHFIAIKQDVSERKTLQQQRERLAAIVEASPCFVATADAAGTVRYYNAAARRMLGLADDADPAQVRIADTHPAWAAERVLGEGIPAAVRDGIWTGETAFLARDGREFPVWQAILAHKAANGGVEFMSTIALDLSSIKQAESQLRNLNAELEQRVAQRTRQIETTNQELESFSYSVSHDLRAPLRAVDGYARMLEEDYAAALDQEARRLIAVVRAESGRMSAMIDDLLTFSRTGHGLIANGAVDMMVAAREAIAQTSPAYPAACVVLEDLPDAPGDRMLLRQVWVNLIGNALKYSSKAAAPRIEIGGRTDGAENRYWVRDNGAGFDPRYADQLFGVFRRLHGETEFPGTGVGLAIVRRVVTRHGGRVWAEGKPGAGACFGFALPRGH